MQRIFERFYYIRILILLFVCCIPFFSFAFLFVGLFAAHRKTQYSQIMHPKVQPQPQTEPQHPQQAEAAAAEEAEQQHELHPMRRAHK